MIYIASPYTPVNVAKGLQRNVMQKRYMSVLKYTAQCLSMGEHVFSPIVHNHHMVSVCDMPVSSDAYVPWLDHMIKLSTELRVLMLDGWEDSKGVAMEIQSAFLLDVPVVYVENNNED